MGQGRRSVSASPAVKTDHDLQVTLERVKRLLLQVANLRPVERNPKNYRLPASGYLVRLDWMTLKIWYYSWFRPTDTHSKAAG